MTQDWNAISLDMIGIDEPVRAALRQMRPFFAKVLPGILARFYDKVRRYDPACGLFKDPQLLQEAIRLQLQHWNLIGAGDFGADYAASASAFCELNRRAGVTPQWYAGCRQMFISDHESGRAKSPCRAMEGVGRARSQGLDAQCHRQAVMMDTETIVLVYFAQSPASQGRHRRRPLLASSSLA